MSNQIPKNPLIQTHTINHHKYFKSVIATLYQTTLQIINYHLHFISYDLKNDWGEAIWLKL